MSALQTALDAFKRGDMIIVTDHADRENEGDLMMLAEKASAEKVAFMVRHTTGILCVALTQERARKLRLPLMVVIVPLQAPLHVTSVVEPCHETSPGSPTVQLPETVQLFASVTVTE